MRRLRQEGYRPRAFVRPTTALPQEWPHDAEVIRGDIAQATRVSAAAENAKTVFHLAAVVDDWGSPELHERVTVRGTENVLGEASRVGARVVLASSVVVYGERIGRGVCDEQQPLGKALGPYSRSKQAQEQLAYQLEGSRGLKVTIVRPTNIYGPNCVPWVDKAIEELHKGSPMLVDGGRLAAGLTYVDNVVDVFVRAAERPGTIGRVYNASDDHGITWLRYFTELAALCGSAPPRSIPRSIARAAAFALDKGFRLVGVTERPPLTLEALNLVGSHHRVPIDRAIQELGYTPPVSYAEGMQAVASYIESKHA